MHCLKLIEFQGKKGSSFNMKLIWQCIICIITTVYAFEETIVIEGADALLTFRFTSESPVPFSLCIGQRDPFYKDGQLILDNLTPSQQKRFRVLAWHSRIQQYTLVQIVIEKVQRTDGGTYTSIFYGTETLTPGSKQRALTIYFPPERAQCWSIPTERDGLDYMQCAAKGGSPPGTIECKAFNKEEVPLTLTHVQNATHILNRFLLIHGTSVYCCAKNDVNFNDITCNDFVLDREGTSRIDNSSQINTITISASVDITDFRNTTDCVIQILDSPKCFAEIITLVSILSVNVVGIIAILCILCRRKSRANERSDYSMVSQNLEPRAGDENRIEKSNYRGNENSTNEENKGTGHASNQEKKTNLKAQSSESVVIRQPPETRPNKKC